MAKHEIKSEVTGSVWKVLVAPGQKVAADETLMLIESMKMEIPVICEDDCTVLELRASEGDPVSEGAVLAIVAM